MATYNGERFLAEQLRSLFGQSCQDFRLVVGDDCSTDDTQNIVRGFAAEHPGRIELRVNETRLGVVGNFAKLIENASADYVMLCDQDDVWLPHKVEKELAAVKRVEERQPHEMPVLVYSDVRIVSTDLEVISDTFWNGLLKIPRVPSFAALLVSNRVTGCTVLMNRALVRRIAGMPVSEVFMHDWWIALVASAFGVLHQIEEPLVLYRQHDFNTIGARVKRNPFGKALQAIHQIGANPAIKEDWKVVKRQAAAFERRYCAELPRHTLSVLTAARTLDEMEPIERRWTIIQNRMFRPGLMSNISLLLGI
jgi:glycosyltransferase involved in cell wall biosynthesis